MLPKRSPSKPCKNCHLWELAEEYLPNPLTLELDNGEEIRLDWKGGKVPLAMQILDAVDQWGLENQDPPKPELRYETSRFKPGR